MLRPWNDPYKDIDRKLKVQSELFFICSINEKIIGTVMAGYDGHRGWLYYLAVSQNHRRKGVAKKLVAEAEKSLLALGCPKINIQIRNDNLTASNYYKNIGFCEDSVISMGKRLIEDN